MSPSPVRITASTFEGMFQRGLEVDDAMAAKLRAIGFDIKRMEPSYPVSVWAEALRLAAREYFPQHSPADAEFELGKRMVDGYFATLVGKVLGAAMPFLSPDTLCTRLPRFFSTGVEGETKPAQIRKLGERHYEATLYGDQGVPWFTAGSVDSALRLTRVKPTVKVAEVKPDHFVIDITWSA